jgi:hypothetical protein
MRLADEIPDLPDAYLTELGRVSVRWSMLETWINFALIRLAGKDIHEGRSLVIFNHMAFPQKLDVLGALVSELLVNSTSCPWLAPYAKEVKPRLDEAQRKRNELIHAKWGTENGQVTRSKITARGSLKIDISPVTVEEIRAVSDLIYEAADALNALIIWPSNSSDLPHKGQ